MGNSEEHEFKLPVFKLVIGAFSTPWKLRKELIAKLAFPILILVIIGLLERSHNDLVSILGMTFVIIKSVVMIIFVITCHRIVILGSKSVSGGVLPRWTQRETRFLGWVLGIYFIATFAIYATVSLSSLLLGYNFILIIAAVPGLHMLARLSVIFPATAVDERPDMKIAWDLTEGNGWRLVLCVCLLPVVLSFLQAILEGEEVRLATTIALDVVSYIIFIIEIAAVSLAFKELRKVKGEYSFNGDETLLTR